ncbi:hypothetical protein TIFTF001_023740 [Ficus carica]|uniref:Uncharacterized protein n=1 Tax=Ficus carica TaxID=3494 RepID=A0AA88AKZ8_FICCA|nr:hypothetical protein TIFTF001_023740 [Ficus carica]
MRAHKRNIVTVGKSKTRMGHWVRICHRPSVRLGSVGHGSLQRVFPMGSSPLGHRPGARP